MQCLWVLQEEGESFVRQGKFALALKRYHQMFDVSGSSLLVARARGLMARYGRQIFTEIEEDQYDFHSYCVRKSTLRAYVK
jgi:hypothetical protein